MDITGVVQVIQLGIAGILLVILWFLWQEYQKLSLYIRDMLTKLADDHEDLASGLRAFMAGDSDAAIKLRRIKVTTARAEAAAANILTAADEAAVNLRKTAENEALSIKRTSANTITPK